MTANVFNRVRSENFQINVSQQQLACGYKRSMKVKLGTSEASLAN